MPPRYKVLAGGIQIESKDQIQQRIGRSPDCADAVVLAYWTGNTRQQPLRTFTLRKTGTRKLSIVVCTQEELRNLDLTTASLLIAVSEPTGEEEKMPEHCLEKLLGATTVTIADVDPAEHQATITEPVLRYGKTAVEAAMGKEEGKKLWSLLTRKRDPAPEVFVVAGDHGIALSVALAICDTLNLGRDAIHLLANPDRKLEKDLKAPNLHVYATVKRTRVLCCGDVVTALMPTKLGTWNNSLMGRPL